MSRRDEVSATLHAYAQAIRDDKPFMERVTDHKLALSQIMEVFHELIPLDEIKDGIADVTKIILASPGKHK